MSGVDTEYFRKSLLQLKLELVRVKELSVESTKPVKLDQASIGRLSRMDAMQVQSMAQETVRRYELQLEKIEGAMRRIESGDFGYCYVCSEEIEKRRLEVDPTATRCVACIES
jgi:DnaK suppressor protein